MRILRLFFFSLLFIGLLGGGAFLATREILLGIAVSQVKSSVSTIRQMKTLPGIPSPLCSKSNLPDVPYGVLESLQLTFTTANEYQIELICDSEIREPEVTNTYTLPPFVTKTPGTAGLLWGDKTSGITLQVFGRQKSLVLENMELSIVDGSLPELAIESPVATCEAYGYTCCASESGIGQGQQTARVRDCPKSCYATCLARPGVLSFTSLPFFDVQTRITNIMPNGSVSFHYIVQFGAAKGGTVTIDFGDGETQMLTEGTGNFEHTYVCPSGSCTYQASLSVSDTQGFTSADTNISKITVQVGPQ